MLFSPMFFRPMSCLTASTNSSPVSSVENATPSAYATFLAVHVDEPFRARPISVVRVPAKRQQVVAARLRQCERLMQACFDLDWGKCHDVFLLTEVSVHAQH